MNYTCKNHSKFLIVYHIMLVVKYRKLLLIEFGDCVKNKILNISTNSNFKIREMEVDKDHINLMIEGEPKVSPLQIVRKLKQETTFHLWKSFPGLVKHFWKEKTFWSDGYFCCSIGNASIETVKKYIESQG